MCCAILGIRIWASVARKLSRMIYKNISNLKGKKASFQNHPFGMDKNFTSFAHSIFKSNILPSWRREINRNYRLKGSIKCETKSSANIVCVYKSANTDS